MANVVFTIGWDKDEASRPTVDRPHATNEAFDKQKFKNACQTLTGKITFSREAYPGGGTSIGGNDYVVKDGQNAIVYSQNGGGVFFQMMLVKVLFVVYLVDLEQKN